MCQRVAKTIAFTLPSVSELPRSRGQSREHCRISMTYSRICPGGEMLILTKAGVRVHKSTAITEESSSKELSEI